jgi:hypothetical protein
MVISPED